MSFHIWDFTIWWPPNTPPLAADLACAIAVSSDQAGADPIPDGGEVCNGSVVDSQWAHITMENRRAGNAANFVVELALTNARFKVGNDLVDGPMRYTMSLAPHSLAQQHVQVWTPYGGNHTVPVTVKVTLDTGNVIPETNEQNNTATIHYTVEHVT